MRSLNNNPMLVKTIRIIPPQFSLSPRRKMKIREMCTTSNSNDDHFQNSDIKFNQQTASEDIQFNKDTSSEDTKVDFMRVLLKLFLNFSKN